jgi:hypothetical protein
MNSNKQKWLGLCILFLACADMCFGQLNWSISNLSASVSLNSVTYGNSQFVTVGVEQTSLAYCGIILTSSGNTIWRTSYSDTASSSLNSVTYGNGKFVAVGYQTNPGATNSNPSSYHGIILNSTNGTDWIIKDSSATWPPFYSVTYGNNQFVAVGDSGIIFTSPNGLIWTRKLSGTTSWLSSVAYGNSRFVAVGPDTILTSPDGTTWSKKSFDTTYFLSSVTYGNDQFVTVGFPDFVMTSSDAMTWTTRHSGTGGQNGVFLQSVAYGSGQFVAVGGYNVYHAALVYGRILVSPEGITWTPSFLPNSNIPNRLNSVTYGNNQFMAVGENIVMTGSADVAIIQTVLKKPIGKNIKFSINKNDFILSLPIASSDGNKITVEVFNTVGKRIYSTTHQTHSGILSIPVSGLSQGAYLMSITGGNTTLSSSFVISK